MKKPHFSVRHVLPTLLALLVTLSAFAVAPSAAPAKEPNARYDVPFTEEPPVIDGDISAKEYGSPMVDWLVADGAVDGFVLSDYLIKDDADLEIEFYSVWTDTDLYLAWKVHTKYDYRIPDNIADSNMFNYCCVQFMLTPGAPDNTKKVYQTAEWSGDYLEVGMCQRSDGLSYKVCWSQPAAAGNALKLSDWEFAGSRDDDKEITTYECRLPLDKTGIAAKGDGAQFGLTWAVGAQENYATTKGLIEWQDAIISGKNADNAAVMTMTGSGEGQQNVELGVASREKMPHGDLPDGLEESLFQITLLDHPSASEQITLLSAPDKVNENNPNYSQTLLLRPEKNDGEIEGYYTLLESINGSGSAVTFQEKPQEGDLVLLVHSDDTAGNTDAGKARALAKELAVGQRFYLHGVEWKNDSLSFKYNNAQLVVIEDDSAKLVGTWKSADGKLLVLQSGGKGTQDGKEIAWALAEEGKLTLDGKTVEYTLDGGKLTLDGVEYASVMPGDYAKLQTACNTAKAELAKTTVYTAESLDALQKAYDEAQKVVEAAYTADEQSKIDDAEKALQAAIKALVKQETDGSSSASSQVSSQSSAASASSSADASSGESGGPSGGMIVLIVVLALVVVAAVVVIIVVVRKKKA